MNDTDCTNPRTRPRASRPADRIDVRVHEVALAGLPLALAGTTIVQLTDLHYGCGGTAPLIAEAVDRANSLRPDYAVLTGDLVDRRPDDVCGAVDSIRGLEAPRGVYAVLGNHDHYADAALVRARLEAAGVRVLINEAEAVADGLWFAGTDDRHMKKDDLASALSAPPAGAGLVLLAHHPGTLDEVPADRPMLILSGHTHGGQVRMPFLPASIVCRVHLRTRYVHGWYHRGAARMYLSRGIGVTGSWPLCRRLGCPPELAVFRLVPARAA